MLHMNLGIIYNFNVEKTQGPGIFFKVNLF